PAHAAPLATGGNVILGQANDAGATTALANTPTTTPTYTLQVSNDVQNLANAAIYAVTSGANGLYAVESNGGNGVVGIGLTSMGYGVYGGSDVGWGVVGDSGGGADIGSIGTGIIYQVLQGFAGAPSKNPDGTPAGPFLGGESIRDSNGDLWLCVAAGSPGTWVKVAHLSPGLPGGAISYLSKPIRLFDSRSGATDALFHPGAPCAANSSTTVQVSGDAYNGVTVPASVAGAIGNVTVLNAAGSGFVELVPSGAGFTGAANLAFAPGQIISNAFNVGLNSTGALDIYVGSSAVDVIVDLFAIVA
ncbi:MAG TPA: hypothetical protein VE338_10480, partial [Ktedonobacterales bacterium]|nr:hypothetical protein [Ktedonobacterales bacterium]